MKKIALLLSLCAIRLFAANPSFNDFNANQFSTTGNKVAIKSGALVTNLDHYGTILFETNGSIRGGTNLIFGLQEPTSTNKVTQSAAALIVGTARNNATNHIVSDGSAIIGVASNSAANVIAAAEGSLIVGLAHSSSTNEITGGEANFLFGRAGTTGGRGSGPGRNTMTGNGNFLLGTANGGSVNIMSGSSSAMFATSFGVNAVNSSSGNNALAFMNAGAANSTNEMTGSGGLFSLFANAGGRNTGGNQSGMFFLAYASGGSNDIGGNGNVLIGSASSGGMNSSTIAGGRLFGFAVNGGLNDNNGGYFSVDYADQATNKNTGTGSQLFGYADSVVGSLVNSGQRSFIFGSGNTNSRNDTFAYYSRGAPLIYAQTNFVGINTNGAGSGIALEVNGSGHVSKDFHVEGFLEASHGSLTMCTGIVTVATSQSTNLINNIWSYAHLDAPLGIETNTLFVVTNAAHFFISFGAAVSANASGSGTISLHVSTNGVLCDSILFFEAPSQGASTYETGFKEFAIDLPAMCRVGLWVGETTAQSVNLKNVCFNMKGGN